MNYGLYKGLHCARLTFFYPVLSTLGKSKLISNKAFSYLPYKMEAIIQILLSKGYVLQNVNIRTALEAKQVGTYCNEV